jgi:PAS domain S-box-containing protein
MPSSEQDRAERWSVLADLLPDAVLMIRDGRVAFANPAAHRLFAVPTGEDLVGRPVLDLITPDMRAVAETRLAVPPPDDLPFHYCLLRRDGTLFEAEVTSRAIDLGDGAASRLVTFGDAAERHRLTEQMLRISRLAALGEMAAGIVHELAQPLNVIRMAAESAQMLIERGAASPDWQRQQFDLIAAQVARASEIIDDIRLFSRRDTPPAQPFDAIAAARTAVEMLRGQLTTDGIRLCVDLPAETAPVSGRRQHVEQAVINLISNAHHAVRERQTGPCPAGWVGLVRVEVRRTAGELVIRVSDSGPGLPAAVRQQMFTPFFTTKPPGQGTGLGLSISLGMIRAMNGRLIVEDSAEGACLAIILPLIPGPGAAEAPADGAGHALLATGVTPGSTALGAELEALGCRVSVVADAVAAWGLFQRDPADIVVVDAADKTATSDLVARLRDYDPWIPILVLTRHSDRDHHALVAAFGDERCFAVTWPMRSEELRSLIADLLAPPP